MRTFKIAAAWFFMALSISGQIIKPKLGTASTANISDFDQNAGLVWLKNTEAKLQARGTGGLVPPIHEMIIGDSIATGFETISRFSGEHIAGYKLAGWHTVSAGTVTKYNGSDNPVNMNKWINGVYFSCAVGSTSDWFYLGTTSLRADRIGVGYLQGTGSFKFQYSINGGTWTDAATIDTSAVTGAGYNEYTVLNSYLLPVKCRITDVTTAAVEIVGVGYWLNNQGGVVQSLCHLSGNSPTAMLTTPANIVSGIVGGCDPDIVIAAWNDPASNWAAGGSSNWDTIVSRFEAGHSAIDWLLVSGNPFNPASSGGDEEAMVKAQAIAQKAWAIANKESFIDGYSMFRSYADSIARGFLTEGDDYHLTATGRDFRNRVIREIINRSISRKSGSGIPLSSTAFLRHTGLAGDKVEIGALDSADAAASSGLFLRPGSSTNGLKLGSRTVLTPNDTLEVYMTGGASTDNLKLGVWSTLNNYDFVKLTGAGNTTSGRSTVEFHYPTSIRLRKSTGADPTNPAAGNAELFTRLNGSSKIELCVIFPSGAVQVISTEP